MRQAVLLLPFLVLSTVSNALAVELMYSLDPPPLNEYFGASVLGLGDLDGDGNDEFVVGDFGADGVEIHVGRVSLYRGGLVAPASPYLNLEGDIQLRKHGWRLARAGDFDGDGTQDLVVSALNGTSTGAIPGRIEIHFDIENMDAVPDVELIGPFGQWFGQSMAGGHDINNDGRDDLVVGTWNSIPGDGRAFVFLGSSSPTMNPSATLFTDEYRYITAVAMLGDLNSDGYADFAVSHHGEEGATDNEGEVLIFHGSNPVDMTPEFTIHGNTGERLGRRMTSADLNGDGHLDLLAQAGEEPRDVYVYLGGPLFDTVADLVLEGSGGLANLGDVNGDAVDDVGIVDSRQIRVFYGADPMDDVPDAILASPHYQAELAGADVDGDGLNELLVGSLHSDRVDVHDEMFSDCNDNDQPDFLDAQLGLLEDCNGNGLGDACDLVIDPFLDCNDNGLIDGCEIAADPSIDCDASGIIDTCEQDCNDNGLHDSCDIASDPSLDCDQDGNIDTCQVAQWPFYDCDTNGLVDTCEITSNAGLDCNLNGDLDSCDIAGTPQLDCDTNGAIDDCEIAADSGLDCDDSLTLDACDLAGDPGLDCNTNGWFDACERQALPPADCDGNDVIDTCDITGGTHGDGDGDGLPDLCETPVHIGAFFDPELTANNFEWTTVPIQAEILVAMKFEPPFDTSFVSRVEFRLDIPNGVLPYRRTLLVPGLNIAPPESEQWVINLSPAATPTDGILPLVRYEVWVLNPLVDGKIAILDETSGEGTLQINAPYWIESDGSGHLVPDARPAWIKRTFEDCNFNGIDDLYEIAVGYSSDTNADGIPDTCQGITAVEPLPEYKLGLAQNAPNPFNPATTIGFSLAEDGPVELVIFDTAGRFVKRLASGTRPAGIHQVTWRGDDASGSPVASGVYFYQLDAGGRVMTKKMALLR